MKTKHQTRKIAYIAIVFMIGIINRLALGQSFTNYQSASLVIGQPNFTTAEVTTDQNHVARPSGVAVAADGRVAISQFQSLGIGTGRVVLYNSTPTVNGAPANLVLGRTGFNDTMAGLSATKVSVSCFGVAFSPDGSKLVVSDSANNRVLIWTNAIIANGQAADVVVGQPDFVTGTPGSTVAKMNTPFGVLVTPAGQLIVSDFLNNRVLVYNAIPTMSGANAGVVIGQPDFVSNGTGNGPHQLSDPTGLAITSDGRLLIADSANHRVLIFNGVPLVNGVAADYVIGQSTFGTSGAGTSAYKLNTPSGISISPDGVLAISEYNNHRVMLYKNVPFANGVAADVVLGRPDFVTPPTIITTNAQSTFFNYGPTFDTQGRLYVSSAFHNRVIVFNPISTNINVGTNVISTNLLAGTTTVVNPKTNKTLKRKTGKGFNISGKLIGMTVANKTLVQVKYGLLQGSNAVVFADAKKPSKINKKGKGVFKVKQAGVTNLTDGSFQILTYANLGSSNTVVTTNGPYIFDRLP